jgi:hypothetical protein
MGRFLFFFVFALRASLHMQGFEHIQKGRPRPDVPGPVLSRKAPVFWVAMLIVISLIFFLFFFMKPRPTSQEL